MLEAVEGGIEGALLDGERAAGDLLDAQQDAYPCCSPSDAAFRISSSSVPGSSP